MKKFEYKTNMVSLDQMNQLGIEGWELVAIVDSVGYFKREVVEVEEEVDDIETTQRGFSLFKFTDRYDKKCSLQKSSLATEDCIWLGLQYERMHLSQDQVAMLLPMLEQFVKTGDINIIYPEEPTIPEEWDEMVKVKELAEFGYKKGEYLSTNCSLLFNPEEEDAFRQAYVKDLKAGKGRFYKVPYDYTPEQISKFGNWEYVRECPEFIVKFDKPIGDE